MQPMTTISIVSFTSRHPLFSHLYSPDTMHANAQCPPSYRTHAHHAPFMHLLRCSHHAPAMSRNAECTSTTRMHPCYIDAPQHQGTEGDFAGIHNLFAKWCCSDYAFIQVNTVTACERTGVLCLLHFVVYLFAGFK